MTPPPPSHSFLYESGLCTLPEGQTLAQWRRPDDAARPSGWRRVRQARRARAHGRRRAADARAIR